MYLNDVKLIGKVRYDAPLKTLDSGDAILNFMLVTMENFTNRNGNPVTRKETHRIAAFNKAAESAAPEAKLFAGTEVLVEGFLRSHESGGLLVTEVIARRIQTISRAGSASPAVD